MNKFVLIHGLGSSLDNSFGIKVKERLVNRGYEVIEPIFPVKGEATLEAWTKVLDSLDIDDNCNFLCHSLGATFIIKYLFYKGIKANLVIAVAGGLYDKAQDGPWVKFPKVKEFEPTKEEFDYFENNVNTIYLIHSDNDHIFNQSNFDAYIQKTGAREIVLKGQKHFGKDSGVKDIPIIESILDK